MRIIISIYFDVNLDSIATLQRICDLSKTSLSVQQCDVDDECNGCGGDQRLRGEVCLHSWGWL
jgi:hypothetical protein